MAVIVHRCKKCQHNNLASYDGQACGVRAHGSPPCCKACQWGPATLLPTWDGRGNPVREVTVPGTNWNPGQRTCGCEECRDLYEQIGKPYEQ